MGDRRHLILAAGLSVALAGCAPRQPSVVPQAQPSPARFPVDASQLTEDELGTVRQQIMSCWYIDPKRVPPRVEILVVLSQDGMVQSAEVADSGRTAIDVDYREGASVAIRAVKQCSPLRLPRDKYATWRRIHFYFDASGVMQ